jgi:serine/threonine-protein kinase
MTLSGDKTAGPSAPPALLADRYERRQLLGAGGMGEVYLGHDRLLDRNVAVKILRPQFIADPVFVARFLREATAAARLSHPNVVAIFDAGSDDETHYIVMEHIQGRTLRQELDEHGPLPAEEAVAIGSAVAAALQAAHAQGLIHRDVKPGNVMLTDDGRVKVVDFGIARVADAAPITQTAALLGTPQYLAPEQAQGSSLDARADLYALGVCLYELLTGSPPFADGTPVAIAYRHIHEQPRPPSQLRPDMPAWLESVVLKAMAKDPQARYQTAADLRADLVRTTTAEAIPIPSPTPGATRVMPLPARRTTAVPGRSDRRASVRAGSAPAMLAGGRHRLVVALALAGLLLGGLTAITLPRFIGDGRGPAPDQATAAPPERLVMPQLRGLPVEAARTQLQALGLQRPPTLRRQFDGSVAEGRVIATDPPARALITPASPISLLVSDAPQSSTAQSDQERDGDGENKGDNRGENRGEEADKGEKKAKSEKVKGKKEKEGDRGKQ